MAGGREDGTEYTRKCADSPKPFAEYLLCNSTIDLYSAFVMPHAEATLTTMTTFPLHSLNARSLPSMSLAVSSEKLLCSDILGFAHTCLGVEPLRTTERMHRSNQRTKETRGNGGYRWEVRLARPGANKGLQGV